MNPADLVQQFVGKGVTLTKRKQKTKPYGPKRKSRSKYGKPRRHREPNLGQSKDHAAYMREWRLRRNQLKTKR